MCRQRPITRDFFRHEIAVSEVARVNGSGFLGSEQMGLFLNIKNQGQELDQFELMRLYPAKEFNNA